MPFTDEFIKKNDIGKEYLANIEIGICNNCGSVQNLNDTDMEQYYNEYTYTVQSSQFAMDFMKTVVNRIHANFFLNSINPKVLEIGSGSGEQLFYFKELGFKVLGIEPSEKLSKFANNSGIKTLTSFFDENTKEVVDEEFKKVDLVISSYTFDHIPRPVEVLKNIYSILSDEGYIMLEVHNLNLIKERNEFCLFEHEHYTYLNENTMTQLLNFNGFEVKTFELLTNAEKRANSLLVIAQKTIKNENISFSIPDELTTIKKLSENIYTSINNFDEWLIANSSKNIVAYGAGGRGIMTIAALRNSDKINFIVDKNPKDKDIYSPKSHLKVYGLEIFNEIKPEIIVVFSFGYFDEIKEELTVKYGLIFAKFISILDILKTN
jgi:SAM-dependent methyltransferase